MRITIRLFLALNFLLCLLSGQVLAQALPIVPGANQHLSASGGLQRADGQLIVKFRRGTPANAIDSLTSALGGHILKFHSLSGMHRLGFPSNANLAQILNAMRSSAIVEEAGYNYRMRTFRPGVNVQHEAYRLWALDSV